MRLGEHPYAKELASLGLPKRALVSSSAANVEMSFGDAQEVLTMTHDGNKPDVDLTDGAFYAGDSRSIYKWMRENEPVFRDRNGLAAAATYQAVIEAERQPELFSNAGGIRPDQPPAPMMIEMDDPQHLLRRKLVNSGFTRKRVKDLEGVDRFPVRRADRRGVRAGRVRFRLGSRRTAADGGHRRHARRASRRNGRCSSSGPTTW